MCAGEGARAHRIRRPEGAIANPPTHPPPNLGPRTLGMCGRLACEGPRCSAGVGLQATSRQGQRCASLLGHSYMSVSVKLDQQVGRRAIQAGLAWPCPAAGSRWTPSH